MELFKTNGQLKPRKALLPHYVEYRTQIAKDAFDKAMRAEHESLYPLKIQDGVDEFGNAVMADNPNYIDYELWMAEDMVTQVAQDAVYDADGITVVTPAVEEARELVRPFVAPEALESELDEYLASSVEYKAYLSRVKKEKLGIVTVTTISGKEFYGDAESRVDISDAIAIAYREGQTSTMWKLVSGWTSVTVSELEEAQKLSLEAKGTIIA